MRHRIQSGQWKPGQKISTLEELEREFEVARVTVRQAVEILRGEVPRSPPGPWNVCFKRETEPPLAPTGH